MRRMMIPVSKHWTAASSRAKERTRFARSGLRFVQASVEVRDESSSGSDIKLGGRVAGLAGIVGSSVVSVRTLFRGAKRRRKGRSHLVLEPISTFTHQHHTAVMSHLVAMMGGALKPPVPLFPWYWQLVA